MKKRSLYCLLFLLSFINLSVANAQEYNKDNFVGYWTEYVFIVTDSCSLDSIPMLTLLDFTLDEFLSDSLMIDLIKEEGDSSAWEIEFKPNGTFIGNGRSFCKGKTHQTTGEWDYKKGELAMKQLRPCSSSKLDPLKDYYYPIQWLSSTTFYMCGGEEGPGNPVIILFNKIPDGLISPQ
ncbi:MAG: hypothetical protein GQ574_28580 [Crocinitomix sp.]|nr:hypothetical protein [Crocinitomix sp.]